MSLLDSAMEPFAMMDKKSVTPDGYGGVTFRYEEGARFEAAATFDTSVQARVGAVQGVTSLYTVTTRKTIILDYHDVIKRVSDGLILRVTSRGQDKATPESATLDMRQVSAEQYTLPS